MYGNPAEFRSRYTRDSVDEFTHLSDGELVQSLSAASAEIDSWRPAGVVSIAGTAVLTEKAYILARMMAHQDQALGDLHPIVRDGLETRSWLRALAGGSVHLPSDDVERAVASTSIAAPERPLIYDDTFSEQYRQL